jgi:hypothetical protein
MNDLNIADYKTAVCPECGKTFFLASRHSLTNGRGVPVCSCHCSTAAWKREEARRQERRKRAEARRKRDAERKREKYLQRKQAEWEAQKAEAVKTPEKSKPAKDPKPRKKSKPHGNSKAVDVYTKDGTFVKRFPSLHAAAENLRYSHSWIGKICRGEAELPGEYTLKYAENSKEAKA